MARGGSIGTALEFVMDDDPNEGGFSGSMSYMEVRPTRYHTPLSREILNHPSIRIEQRGFGTPCILCSNNLSGKGSDGSRTQRPRVQVYTDTGEIKLTGKRDGRPAETRYFSRAVYEQYVRLLEDREQVDHLCKEPTCIEPGHLEGTSGKENRARSNSGAEFTAKQITDLYGLFDNGANPVAVADEWDVGQVSVMCVYIAWYRGVQYQSQLADTRKLRRQGRT